MQHPFIRQTISGTSLADAQTQANYSLVLTLAIAESVNLKASNVLDLVISAGPVSRRRAQSTAGLRLQPAVTGSSSSTHWFRSSEEEREAEPLGSRRLQSALSPSVNIQYEVRVNAPGYSYTSVSTKLQTSVDQDLFSGYLQKYARLYNVSGLQNATSSQVNTTDLNVLNTNSAGSSAVGLSQGGLIGVIVGVALAVAALVALVVCYNWKISKDLFSGRLSLDSQVGR